MCWIPHPVTLSPPVSVLMDRFTSELTAYEFLGNLQSLDDGLLGNMS